MFKKLYRSVALFLCLVLVSSFIAPMTQASAARFTDVPPNAWFREAVEWAASNAITSGTTNTTFSPQNRLTRADFVTFLYRLDGQPQVSNNVRFADNSNLNRYFFRAVNWAAENQIVTGFADGLFRPFAFITREEIAVILLRYDRYKGNTSRVEISTLDRFTDRNGVSSFAREGVSWAASRGILRGDNSNRILPRNTATRAESITMLFRYATNEAFVMQNTVPRVMEIKTGAQVTVSRWSDGSIRAIGNPANGQTNVSALNGAIQLSVGTGHAAGRRANGTLVAVGNPANWQNIQSLANADNILVAAGGYHTMVLRRDGTVRGVGRNQFGQLNVESWSNIRTIVAGGSHTVGLRGDGRVVATGRNYNNQITAANSWSGITAIAAGSMTIIGLRTNGTVVAAGARWNERQLNVGGWNNIVAIDAGTYHTVGLRADGRVVATGSNQFGQLNVQSWSNIVAISAAGNVTVGLRSDGRVMAVGHYTGFGNVNLSSWN